MLPILRPHYPTGRFRKWKVLTVKRSQANSLATTNYAGASQQVGDSDTQPGQGGVVRGTEPELTEGWRQNHAWQIDAQPWQGVGQAAHYTHGETEAQRKAGLCQNVVEQSGTENKP